MSYARYWYIGLALGAFLAPVDKSMSPTVVMSLEEYEWYRARYPQYFEHGILKR